MYGNHFLLKIQGTNNCKGFILLHGHILDKNENWIGLSMPIGDAQIILVAEKHRDGNNWWIFFMHLFQYISFAEYALKFNKLLHRLSHCSFKRELNILNHASLNLQPMRLSCEVLTTASILNSRLKEECLKWFYYNTYTKIVRGSPNGDKKLFPSSDWRKLSPPGDILNDKFDIEKVLFPRKIYISADNDAF